MATGGWTHVLTELSPLDALEGPLRRSARLRYTCLSVSKKYIALGSNTGGVYIFTRDTLKHLQVVYGDVESSPLAVTALSPNDNFVAYSTGSGQVIVMEMNIEKRQKPDRVRISSDHVGSTVTCLHWDGTSTKLFVGDNIGKISVCYVPSSKAKTLFIQPSEIILRLDASVVQLDWWGEKLLVSTWTRSYLLNTNRQQYSQIGKKLRDGEYGACFFLEPSSQYPVVYCSRPGSRVWEADFDANVLNTHQFKQLLAIPPLPIINFHNPVVEFADPTEVYKHQSVGFNKLCRLGPYLITWAGKRVYVFDPVRVRIILWNEQHSGVKDMVTSGTEIYIFLEDQSLCRLHLLPVERCLQLLLAKQVWSVAGELLCYLDNFVAVPFIQKHISLGSLNELVKKLFSEGHCDLAERVQGMMDEMMCLSDSPDTDSMNGDVLDSKSSFLDSAVKLPSGIFLVNNGLKPSHEAELYGIDDLSCATFAIGEREVFGAVAISQVETIQRCTSVDNLDSGSQHSDILSGDRSIRKSFSTTALDTMNAVSLHQDSTFVDTSQMGSIRPESRTEMEASSDFTDVCLDDGDISQDVFRVSEQGDNSTWNQGTKGDNHEDGRSRDTEPVVLPKTDSLSEVSEVTAHVIEVAQHSSVTRDVIVTSAVVEDMAPVIVEPMAVPRKSGKKKRVTQVDIPSAGISTSEVKVNRGQFKRSASTGSLKKTTKRKELKSIPSINLPIKEEDSDRGLYTKVDQDLDTISIDTLSSVASEEDGYSQTGEITPDTLSLSDGDNLLMYCSQNRSRTPIFQTDEEVIPSLLQRLSASGVSADDSAASSKDGSPVSQSSLGQSVDSTGSGSPQHSSQSPKMALLAVKDSLSSKFSSKTKSLIQTIRKKSPLGKPNFDHPFDQATPDHEEDSNTVKMVRTETHLEDVDKKDAEDFSIADALTQFQANVDLTKLESSTVLTKRQLQDISLLLNPEALKSLLLDWMTVLHRTLQRLHQEVDQEREVKAMESLSRKRQLLSERRASLQKEKSKNETEENKGRQSDTHEELVGENSEKTQRGQENHVDGTQTLDSAITDGSTEVSAEDDCPDNNHDVVTHPQDSDGGTEPVLSQTSLTDDGQTSALGESQPLPGEVTHSVQVDRVINENNNNKSENLLCDESDECGNKYIPIDWMDIFHFKDPFHLSSKFHTDMAELCAICFEAGCHGNISKYISTVPGHPGSDAAKIEISSEQEVACPVTNNGSLSKASPDGDPSSSVKSVNDTKCGSSFMCESYCDHCDEEMAMFVRCYFHCFSVDQLQKSLGRWKHNWFSTWAAVVKASQAFGKDDPVDEKLTARDYNGAIDLLRSFILPNKHAFLGHVARLLGSGPSRAIEFGAEVPKHISMQDIVNMCRLHSIPTASSLTKYVQLRLGEMPSYLRLQIISQLCTRKYLTLTLLDSLLTSGHSSDYTSGAEPSPGSHMTKIANGDLIDCVLDICAEQDFEEALNACKSHRYWCGCLHLWRKTNSSSWQQMLNLIVRLGDISLLDDAHCYGYLPKTAEEWHYFLQEYTQSLTSQSKTTESDWMNTLTWEGIGELMLKTIGPRVAIMLLQDYNIPEGQLNSHFYQTCILESILQRQQRLVVHNMLEKVDTYLWAKKQPHLAPQLLYAVSAEKRGRSGGEDQQEYQKLFSRLSINQSSESRSVEDAEAHWGIAADVTGGCGNCSLPLTETVSHIVPGVIIFTCGHSFHKFCVPLKHCSLCLEDPTLTDDLHTP